MLKFCNIDLGRFEIKTMMPIDSTWVTSYSTTVDPNVVSVTIYEIFDV